MTKGKVLVDQITKDGSLVEDYDQSLSPSEIFDRLSIFFPNLSKEKEDPRFFVGDYRGHKYAIRCKNVTYLGNPHPHFKKRIQIAEDLCDFYQFALKMDAVPLLMGIYSFDDNTVFVNFKIDTYIEKKAHNSSAHVYVSDLVAATEEGYFQKIDYFDNTVTAIRPDVVNIFLDEIFDIDITPKEKEIESSIVKHKEYEQKQTESIPAMNNGSDINIHDVAGIPTDIVIQRDQPADGDARIRMFASYVKEFKEKIAPTIRDFFAKEEKEWNGVECYKKMIAANYRNKYQPEWAGFFLEYEFEKYLTENNLQYLITYAQDKTDGGIDLDLFFPSINSYGDLKAHSEESRGIQGNDRNTIFSIINRQDEKNHVYYIVCEHSTEKDSIYDYEVTKFWNTVQGKADLMSYSKRMKNRVHLKRVYILDINFENKEYLSIFRQGINSNGKPREPKIMIEQDNLPYFIMEQIDL